MKKYLVASLMLAVLFVSAAGADVVNLETIVITQTTFGNAGFDGSALAWDGGFNAYIETEGGAHHLAFQQTNLNFNFSLVSDDTIATGHPAATFDLVGTWTLDFYEVAGAGTPTVTMAGTMNSGRFGGKYLEEQTGSGALDGKAWLTVDTLDADETWLLNTFGANTDFTWDDDIVGLDSSITLAGPISDYQAPGYSAPYGLTVTLLGDQTQVVPEPMTIALLGLGGLLIRRKK